MLTGALRKVPKRASSATSRGSRGVFFARPVSSSAKPGASRVPKSMTGTKTHQPSLPQWMEARLVAQR
jgi:hypothetical protein